MAILDVDENAHAAGAQIGGDTAKPVAK